MRVFKIKKVLIFSTVVALLLILQITSFAWLIRPLKASMPNNFGGSTEVIFFESGDGSLETPYVISTNVHLYNLAWLQYLGYFNLGENVSNKRAQNYFVLKNNIDMNGLAIPPIGTEEYPFLGNFNGNGFTIYNGITANAKDLLIYKPDAAKFDVNDLISAYAPSTNDVAQIIGFFGVIGDYNGAINNLTSRINSSTIGTINANQISAGYFYLNNHSVHTISSNTTIGIAAGYVNATLTDVGVSNSSLEIENSGSTNLTTHISDYTLVGYATNNAKTILNVRKVQLSVPKTDKEEWIYEGDAGSDNGWGGSVNMADMHKRLQFFRSNSTTTTNYVYDRSVEVGVEGKPTNTLSESTGTFYTKSTDPLQGYFVFSSNSAQYTYLHGGTTITETEYYLGDYTTAYLIFNSNGNYLSVNGESITSTTDSTKAAKWFFSNGTNGGYISTLTNGFLYYLTNSDGTLTLSRNHTTSWVNTGGILSSNSYYLSFNTNWYLTTTLSYKISSGNGAYLTINSNGQLVNTNNESLAVAWTFENPYGSGKVSSQANGTTYYLHYSSGLTLTTSLNTAVSWTRNNGVIFYNGNYIRYNSNNSTWETNASSVFYISDGNGNYLRLNSTNLQNATLLTDATAWTFSNGISGGTISSGNRYLRYSGGLTTTTNSSQSNTSWTFSNNRLSTGNYYLKFSRSSWSASTGTGNSTLSLVPVTTESLSLTPIVLTISTTTAQKVLSRNRTYVDTSGTNITYFPLQVNESNQNYQVVPKNTGYIISSSQDRTTTGTYPDKSGDIRVSWYAKSSITSTYLSNNKINKVITVNSGGTNVDITNSTSYEKLAKAKSNFESILSASSNLYGLHFMNATVSIDNLINVPTAVINNVTYTNYQMPTDCIDFRLKEQGYINFFAGTYFNGNNSFFSLYDIIRDESNNITDIKRIVGIYADNAHKNYSYVYLYDDGTYSRAYTIVNNVKNYFSDTTNLPSGYTLKFNTAWIEKNSIRTDALYYFEIPVNDGEYALGSTSGGTGSYLLYLDIGANAQTIERTIISETITTLTETYSYANGVGILASRQDQVYSFSDSDIIGYRLPANSTGTLVITRTGSAVTLTGISGFARYMAEGLTINGGSTSPPEVSITRVEKRLTYVDYNTVTDETTITVISQIDNNTPTMIVYLPNGSTQTDPYRKTSTRTDSINDIYTYFQSSTVSLLEYSFTVHEGAQVGIVYAANYSGSQGYNINTISREMLITSSEGTVIKKTVENYIEDSGTQSNHLSSTYVTIKLNGN
jgi:hypothetical protein